MRIAVVDHSYHKKTKSSLFFTEIAAECGTVDKFYCEQWQGGNPVSFQRLIDGRYDAILYFQQLYSPRQMQNAGSPAKTLLVPMYDAVADWKAKHWRKYTSFPIISFSRKLHSIVTSAGCSSELVTYFPNVPQRPQQLTARTSGRPVVFFWQRTNAVTWRTCKALIGDTEISKVIVRSCPDPFQDVEVISDDDRERFGV